MTTTPRRSLSFLVPLLGLVLWGGEAWAAGKQPALVDSGSWYLTLITFAPVAGMLVLLLPFIRGKAVKWVALAFSAVPLVLTAFLVFQFDPGWNVAMSAGKDLASHVAANPAYPYVGAYGLQFVERVVWIPAFNIEYFMGLDGLSVTMIVLTALVSFLCIIASWGIDKQLKGYFILFLMLQAGMTGLFCALDLFLFFVFWEVMLLPMYFLIGIWGAPPRGVDMVPSS